MGTAKYDHPGYVADTGDAGKYHVGIWCPHGYPAHIHIGRPADGGDPGAARLRVFQSLADQTRCAGGRSTLGAGLLRTVAVDGDYQEIRFELDAEPWGGPMQGGAGLTSCPQRLWKSLGIAAVHV